MVSTNKASASAYIVKLPHLTTALSPDRVTQWNLIEANLRTE